MFEFCKYFRINVLLNAISGIPSPGLPAELGKYDTLLRIHFALSLVGQLNTVVCCSASLINFRSAKDIGQIVSRLGMDLEVFFHMIYYRLNHTRIRGIIENIDRLVAALQTDPLTRETDFTGLLRNHYLLLKYYVRATSIIASSLPTLYAIPKLIRYFETNEKSTTLYEVPYSTAYTPSFEVTLVVQFYVLTFSILKHIANTAFFMSLFAVQTALYRFLRQTFVSVFEPDDEKQITNYCGERTRTHLAVNERYTENNTKIKIWIRFHQQTLR